MSGDGTALPADWAVLPLDEVSSKIQDGTHFSPTLGGTEYRYITSRNIGVGRLRLDSVETISEDEHRKIYVRCDVRLGDLLLTKDGANTGNAALNSFTDEISLLSSVAFIRSNHRRSTEGYVLQYLLSSHGRKQIADAMAGNAITRLTLAKIKALAIPLPPVAEQRRISTVLRDADDLVATLERVTAKKEAIKRGVMQQLLTGQTRLPGFSGPWSQLSAGDIGVFKGGSGFPVRYQGASSGQHPFFKVSDMNTPGNELFMRAARNYINEAQRVGAVLIPMDAIVFAKVGAAVFLERKRILSQPSYIDNNMAAFAIEASKADIRFAHYVLSNFRMGSLAATTAMPSINGGQLRSIPIALPATLDEQRAISRVLTDLDGEIGAVRERLRKAQAIKQGMMQQLLTGRTRLAPAEAIA